MEILHDSVASDTHNRFQMAYGGGIDWNATNRVSIRLIQFDWLPTKGTSDEGGGWVKNVTSYSFGVVFETRPK